MREHKEGTHDNALTRRYNFDRLVYFEWLPSLKEAAAREKQIKSWTRAKRVALIASINPQWEDLNRTLGDLVMLR
jgi:putative endonuclease